MGGWDASRLANFILSLSAIWFILWLGLIALSIALIVLMRTNWGQSKPLHKCAALSLMAHVLLACFATTVHIVSESGGNREVQPIWLTISGTPEPSTAQEDQNAPVRQPWESPAGEVLNPPENPVPPVADSALYTSTRRAELPNIPRALVPGLKVQPTNVPDASGFAIANEPPREAVSGATKIEAPRAQRRDAAETAVPAPAPQRAETATPDKLTAVRKPVPSDPSREGRAIDPAPRLADVRRSQEPASAILDAFDDLSRAISPVPAEQPAPVPPTPSGELTGENPAGSSDENRPSTARADAKPGSDEVAATEPPPSDAEQAQPRVSKPYQQRVAADRKRMVLLGGGSEDTEAAVAAALKWLAANQHVDGRWDADAHGAGKERQVHGHDRQNAGMRADTGMTALALLAFLGAGHTHLEGKYAPTVHRGLVFLLREQKADGNLAGEATFFAQMYCHSMATFCLSEAMAMTDDKRLDPYVRRAVSYSLSAERRGPGGWRYQPGDAGDTSQLGWQVMALKSASLAGISLEGATRTRMLGFLGSVASGTHGGLARYQPHRPVSRAMTAEALFCRQLLDDPLSRGAIEEATQLMIEELPGERAANLYYWYYATLCLYQLQGEPWQQWNDALKRTLIEHQETQGDLAGSWNPDTVWGGYGGRVYTTAMACMCLEVYYRYLLIYAER